MPERPPLLSTAPWVVMVLLVGLAAWDYLDWAQRSAAWVHQDGIIHLGRMTVFADLMSGAGSSESPTSIVGYGPLVYIVTGALMVWQGAQTWLVGVYAQLIFSSLGLLGTGLLAARLGGPWSGPVAVALLAGTPIWRAHSMDLMVDMPGAALCALALGLLASSDGLRRGGWIAGAAVVSGLALVTRWPVVFVLGPAWALMVGLAAVHAEGGRGQRALTVMGIGVAAGILLVAPLLSGPASPGVRGLAWALTSAAGLALLWAGRRSHWGLRALGGAVLLVATTVPITLWAPEGLTAAMGVQLDMHGGGTPTSGLGLGHGMRVVVDWVSGTPLLIAGGAGFLLAVRRTPGNSLVMATSATANLLVVLRLLHEPDDRHVLASLPVVAAFAGALVHLVPPALRLAAGGGLGGLGLAGLLLWHIPDAPGVTRPDRWHRDINLVREVGVPRNPLLWPQSGQLWVSLLPFDGGAEATVATLLHGAFGGREACIAWVVSPDIRSELEVAKTVHALEGPMHAQGLQIFGEEPTDRPGAQLGDYDGAVVFSLPDSDLPQRVLHTLNTSQLVGEVPLEDWVVAVVVVPESSGHPWSTGQCDARFPGTTLHPPGRGWDAGPGAIPGLAPSASP